MEGLQRSSISFRRQGSSGLVWDDKLTSSELLGGSKPESQKQGKEIEDRGTRDTTKPIRTARAGKSIERNRSDGGGRGYRAGKVPPAEDPPSPRLSAFGCCGAFGKKQGDKTPRKNAGKTRSRRTSYAVNWVERF